uniref:Rho GTPase activating protein 44 n=1 Tax=Molossus molossus TaxID=27622 RepID=A0A7J8CVP8_MOLMO|nr:Rho GTPase activating protein 44 [Molossus molossus]
MKKQFNRMRQLANQTVGRAEKTEVLSEDLLQVEKRLELVKQVSHSTHKKLTACLQGQQGAEADKRSKKLPLTTLAQCLMEGSAILGDDTLLGKMLKLCGETEDKLAQELIHFELQVERDVIEPLFLLAEVRRVMRRGLSEQGRAERRACGPSTALVLFLSLTLLCDSAFHRRHHYPAT